MMKIGNTIVDDAVLVIVTKIIKEGKDDVTGDITILVINHRTSKLVTTVLKKTENQANLNVRYYIRSE